MILDQELLVARRRNLCAHLTPGSIAVLPSAPPALRNNDTYFPYRQNSSFYYLTGYTAADSIAIIIADTQELILSLKPPTPSSLIWEGPRPDLAAAITTYGATQAWPLDEFPNKFATLAQKATTIYCYLGVNDYYEQMLWDIWRTLTPSRHSLPNTIQDLRPLVHKLRIYKDPYELSALSTAATISAQAHQHVLQRCYPGSTEAQLEAEFLYYCASQGCKYPAYPPIMASGANACILHYHHNHDVVAEDSLILMDAGAEYQYYAADITRTIPASGKFTPEQRDLYELVLAAQLAVIDILKPGLPWADIHATAVKQITAGLVNLKLLHGDLANLIAQQAYLPFFMHGTSHCIGLDVHDPHINKLAADNVLAPGMVITVEPGIYINAAAAVSPQWHNIGIRIEDMVLITATGCTVLSAAAPKTINAIETLMQDSRA